MATPHIILSFIQSSPVKSCKENISGILIRGFSGEQLGLWAGTVWAVG
jgi:hypothetical protein